MYVQLKTVQIKSHAIVWKALCTYLLGDSRSLSSSKLNLGKAIPSGLLLGLACSPCITPPIIGGGPREPFCVHWNTLSLSACWVVWCWWSRAISGVIVCCSWYCTFCCLTSATILSRLASFFFLCSAQHIHTASRTHVVKCSNRIAHLAAVF